MKFWLYDILACPIDKYYPLTLYIFSIETDFEKVKNYADSFQQRNLDTIRKEKFIHFEKINDQILVYDEIILEKTEVVQYINLILNSINEFNHIYDKTPNKIFKDLLKIIKNELKQTILNYLEKGNYNLTNIQNLLPELYLLNKIKLNIEIATGLLFCNKCKRWYPINETIPQMLPDEFRKEEEEVKFLKSIRNLMEDAFFTQDLKPFNLKL